jgi:hypothetical protein
MSVTDRESGVVTEHISALEKKCKELNVFLFIRPTEYDSTRLIKQGYATKSMSVHDKSSNWGPMAGFVPCDQFFSKKYIGEPNSRPAYTDHGPAKVCHLTLKAELVGELIGAGKMTEILEKKTATRRVFKGVTQNAKAQEIEFQLELAGGDYGVYWCKKNGGTPVKLFVWGYVAAGQPTPVTGDYDLWMVAPHMSWWKLHTQIVGVEDEHGTSGATLLNTWLLEQLNIACSRANNPVFQHGAEAQNYGFTQSLDARIAMVTANGTSRMVDRANMPEIMSDLQSAGYLIYWNKQYGETDPRLSGKGLSIDGIKGSELEKLLAKAGNTSAGILKHLASKNESLRDVLDVKKFYTELTSKMLNANSRGALKFLGPEDLPSNYAERSGGQGTLKAQQALQAASVRFGGGGRDVDRIEDWIDDNIEHIAVLCEAYGGVSGTAASSGAFLLQRITGTNSFKRG